MKLKFYLRGLGIGLIVTTLILTVANKIKNGEETVAQNSTQTQTSIASILNQAKSEAKSETKAETIVETKSLAVVETIAETNASHEQSMAVQTEAILQTEASKEAITVTLSDIMYSEKAAQIIAEAGVISDWSDFNKYLSESGYSIRIHNGTYTLYKGQDYESIAKIISGITK